MKTIMSDLEQELQNPLYAGMTHEQKLSALHGIEENAIGHIRYGDTLHLVSMLARGLRARIEACQIPELKNAFAEALHPSYLASPAYSINVGLPEIRGMLDAGLQVGIVTAEEHAFIIQLATYKKHKFESVTLKEVIAIAEPELLSVGEWQEFEIGESRKVRLKTSGYVPENATVLIQYCESDDGVEWSKWRHATSLSVVSGFNSAAVPHNGLARRMRWRGSEYAISGVMVGV
jgi:hypothetical protein